MPSEAETPPRGASWWTLGAVCVAVFMLLLDITVVNVALPDIQRSLDASFSDLQWVVDAYSLTLAALLHDATEAYLVDVPRPVKPHLHGYRDTEERLARVIELWAGLPHGATSWRLVREADELLLMTEKRDLMAEAPAPWTFAQGVPATPLPEAIQPWTWQVAEWEFRALFERLWKVDAPRPDHFHSCPYCYVKHPCGMACTIEGDLSDDGVDFGAHHACEACERAGADVDDATEAFQ